MHPKIRKQRPDPSLQLRFRYSDLLGSVEESVEASEDLAGDQHDLTEQGLHDLLEYMTSTPYPEFIPDEIIWESGGDTYGLIAAYLASPDFTDLAILYPEIASTTIEFDQALAADVTRFAEPYSPRH